MYERAFFCKTSLKERLVIAGKKNFFVQAGVPSFSLIYIEVFSYDFIKFKGWRVLFDDIAESLQRFSEIGVANGLPADRNCLVGGIVFKVV